MHQTNINYNTKMLLLPLPKFQSNRGAKAILLISFEYKFTDKTALMGKQLRCTQRGKTQTIAGANRNNRLTTAAGRHGRHRHLGNDPTHSKPHGNVTANQVTHQLLLNGKSSGKKAPPPKVVDSNNRNDRWYIQPFTMDELNKALNVMKPNKAAIWLRHQNRDAATSGSQSTRMAAGDV